ncbi:MAG: tetratricopeptide repeat protein [Clostridia bacterium]|nr:tetratricopeptide repeat protein [Clostridia bacterium]
MDDLENKNVFDGNDEEPAEKKPAVPEKEPEANDIAPENDQTGGALDDREFIELQLNSLAQKMKSEKDESILKEDVQDWDGLVDDSRQDAEDYILNESSAISDEKIENIEVMEIDEDDDRLCSVCHRRLKMEKDGITYEYCKRCRNELLETKYNWKSVVTFILSCVVFVFAVALCAVAIVNGLGVRKAASLADKAKLVSASNAYATLVDSSSAKSGYAPASFEDLFGINSGDNTIKNYIKVLFRRGDFSALKTTIETFFPEDELSKPQNADIRQISETVTSLYAVGNAATGIVGSLQDPVSKEDAENAIAELEKLKEDESLNPVFLTYYEYYVSTMIEDGYDLQIKYLTELEKDAPELKVFYVSSFASTYLYKEDYDKAIEYCDMALKDDIEDFTSWRMKIRALSRQKKYDEALELSQEAMKLAKNVYVNSSAGDSASPDITYGYAVYLEQAIIYDIKGDTKKAQDAVDKAYQGQLTLDTLYLYAMINKKNGNDEAYDEVVSMLSQYQMTIPEVCEEYINGTKTLEEIMIDGKVAWYE